MSEFTDDLDAPSIEDTYCKIHNGFWPHECRHLHSKKKKAELTELDILAEKIFIRYTIHRLTGMGRKVDEAYEIAQDFLEYRESRKQNG